MMPEPGRVTPPSSCEYGALSEWQRSGRVVGGEGGVPGAEGLVLPGLGAGVVEADQVAEGVGDDGRGDRGAVGAGGVVTDGEGVVGGGGRRPLGGEAADVALGLASRSRVSKPRRATVRCGGRVPGSKVAGAYQSSALMVSVVAGASSASPAAQPASATPAATTSAVPASDFLLRMLVPFSTSMTIGMRQVGLLLSCTERMTLLGKDFVDPIYSLMDPFGCRECFRGVSSRRESGDHLLVPRHRDGAGVEPHVTDHPVERQLGPDAV